MAKPVCTSLDSPPCDVDGAVVRVRDQNWQQGLGNAESLSAAALARSFALSSEIRLNRNRTVPIS